MQWQHHVNNYSQTLPLEQNTSMFRTLSWTSHEASLEQKTIHAMIFSFNILFSSAYVTPTQFLELGEACEFWKSYRLCKNSRLPICGESVPNSPWLPKFLCPRKLPDHSNIHNWKQLIFRNLDGLWKNFGESRHDEELISDGPAKRQSSFWDLLVFSDELRGRRNSQIYNMALRVTCNIGPGAGSHQGYIPSWEHIPWVNQAFLHCLQCHTCATDTKTDGHTKKSRLQNSQIQTSFHLHQSLGFQSLPLRKSLPFWGGAASCLKTVANSLAFGIHSQNKKSSCNISWWDCLLTSWCRVDTSSPDWFLLQALFLQ